MLYVHNYNLKGQINISKSKNSAYFLNYTINYTKNTQHYTVHTEYVEKIHMKV